MKPRIYITTILSAVVLILMFSLAAEAQTKTVEIKGSKYTPSELTIKQGMAVSWVNKDSSKTHQVFETFNKFLRSPVMFPYDSYNLTFNELGKFEFRDAANPNKMIGHLTVVSEEDYVEEVNATADQPLVNETGSNETINLNADDDTTTDLSDETPSEGSSEITGQPADTDASESESEGEPIVLEHGERPSRIWWITAMILVVAIGAFFAAKKFVKIGHIEIKEEVKKAKSSGISFTEEKEKQERGSKAKILKIDGNILSVKCPNCGNVIKTIPGRHGSIDIACDNCRAHISADIK